MGEELIDSAQPLLYPRRVGTVLGCTPNGTDISFVCAAREGGTFYCKADKDGRPVRAIEWVSTGLAGLVNIPTPFCSILDNEEGETFFGSLEQGSTADEFEVRDFLSRTVLNELGQRSGWLGQYLTRLYVLDLFLNNPDRSLRNFLLERDTRRLCAFDFAAADLNDLSSGRFPVEHTPTVYVGRYLRDKHGFDPRVAMEMIDQIAAISETMVATVFSQMPEDWLKGDQKAGVLDDWSKGRLQRLATLRSGLTDGSLL